MKSILSCIVLTVFLFIVGCTRKIPTPANQVQFEASQLGLSASEASLTVKITFTQETEKADTIVLIASSSTLPYGKYYTTAPAAVNDTLKLPFAKKATSVSFQVKRVEGVYPRSGDQVLFNMGTLPYPLFFGSRTRLELSFSELTATAATMDPDVGGALQPNIVFVDLNANRQHAVSRDAWDLGFYTQGDTFRVVVNPTCEMMARRIDKTSLNAVTAADTVGFSNDLRMDVQKVFSEIGNPQSMWVKEAKSWIDNPAGDMASTAIAEIAANAGDNKVYVINRGTTPDGKSRGWKKVRILRNGTGYELRYADIEAKDYSTYRPKRDETNLFRYVHFEKGLVEVAPRKDLWDIAFSTFVSTSDLVIPNTKEVPYFVKDMVIQNRYKVKTVQVKVDDKIKYDSFGEADLANVNFSVSQVNIGHTWRKGGGPGSSPSLRTDRFYLVQDVQGNIYKLRFTALTQDGERGRPKIEYALVKKATP